MVIIINHSKSATANATVPMMLPPATILTAGLPAGVEEGPAAEGADSDPVVLVLEGAGDVGFAVLRASSRVVCAIPVIVVRSPLPATVADDAATVVWLVVTALVVTGADGAVIDAGPLLKPVRKLGEYAPVPV